MGRFILSLGMVSLFTMILFTALSLSLALPFDYPAPDPTASQINVNLVRRENGNPSAAGDIYGLGLRVGAYLQIFGMLLSCLRSEHRSRDGILLLSSSICLSIFLALTILVSHHEISPCEAWLILSLAAAYGTPRFCAVNEKSTPKRGVSTFCCLCSLLWQQVLYFWFWTTLYKQLPLLGTANLGWFFVPVDLAGWFRIFMLVATCIDAVFTAAAIGPYINMILRRFVYWTGAELSADDGQHSSDEGSTYSADEEEHPTDEDEVADEGKPSKPNGWNRSLHAAGLWVNTLQRNTYYMKFVVFGDRVLDGVINQVLRIVWRSSDRADIPATPQQPAPVDPNGRKGIQAGYPVVEAARARLEAANAKLKESGDRLRERKLLNLSKGFVIWVLTIAGVEEIIKYNSLSPTTNLSTPGQVIPFTLGIITFIVGLTHAVKPTSRAPTAHSVQTPPQESGSYMVGLRTGRNTKWMDLTTKKVEPETS
jgi:hypothetical protein